MNDRRTLTIDEYESGVLSGNTTALARALTLVESRRPEHARLAAELLERLHPHTGQSIRVGVTGAPGSGKSTFIESLGLMLVKQGRRVAVLAVDPSSSISGGSILGDKTRMTGLAAAPGAYIRPSPAAGTLGGVARTTRECLLVCEAAGYDVVLVETVGVGQSETLVADMTDCFLALMLPGAGDELQGIKRGLLELADIIVVNKADGATLAAAKLAASQYAAALGAISANAPPVLTCSALTNQGVDEVWRAIEDRCQSRQATGESDERRRRQSLRWMWMIVEDRLRRAIDADPQARSLRAALEREVLAGAVSPEAAAGKILEALGFPVARASSP